MRYEWVEHENLECCNKIDKYNRPTKILLSYQEKKISIEYYS